ncbi:DUF4440 domain-containing protein [Roseobacter sp. YSTF-M11]|uniref:DUF4440 domain-containing protein n=1 Tax=Roseobacter insulae TaxID=2859783 RepID=A0A9X1K438_9RHOB|nr:DUF4440 domain-containing protein [Roseobacter insulae]MBW4710188.1 DUF4440 domain-containing protein [Roseobacter insulae]
MPSDTSADTLLTQTLLPCETAVWEALVKGDAAQDAAALDETFLGVYPDGFATKHEHVAQLANGPTIRWFSITDARSMALGQGFALLSYLAIYQRVTRETPEQMFVSSIWRREGDTWIGVFSQDTPAQSPAAT